MPFYVGLDLGQTSDFTALAVVQSVIEKNEAGKTERFLHLRHLERYPLRTLYPDIADAVADLMRNEALSPWEHDPSRLRHFRRAPELVVDNTGVGPAVTDLLKKKGLRFKAITITGGDKAHAVGGGKYRVPKRDLVAAVQVLLQNGRLKIAPEMELAPVLKKELLNFRVKIDPRTAHDSYEHWREADHDDLVLATAMPCWYREWTNRHLERAYARGGRYVAAG